MYNPTKMQRRGNYENQVINDVMNPSSPMNPWCAYTYDTRDGGLVYFTVEEDEDQSAIPDNVDPDSNNEIKVETDKSDAPESIQETRSRYTIKLKYKNIKQRIIEMDIKEFSIEKNEDQGSITAILFLKEFKSP